MNNTKKFKYCNAEIDKSWKVCPNCKKNQGFPIWSVTLIVIVVLLIFGAIGSAENYVNTASIEINPSSTSASIDSNSKSSIATTSASVDSNSKSSIATTSPSIDSNLKSSTATTSPSVDSNSKTSTTTTNPSTSQSNIVLDQKSYTVYITKTGKKYHRSGCRYLSKSCISISSSEAISQGYGPCSVCNP